MQPIQPIPLCPASTEDSQQAFWSEMRRIAMKGEEHPASLTEEEIRRVCQLALVAMPKRVVLADYGVSECHGAMR